MTIFAYNIETGEHEALSEEQVTERRQRQEEGLATYVYRVDEAGDYYELTPEELANSEPTETPEQQARSLEQRRLGMAVSMRQARLALFQNDLLSSVYDSLNALPEPDKSAALIEWEYATEVRRSSALVESLSAALSLSPEQLDDLFDLAETL